MLEMNAESCQAPAAYNRGGDVKPTLVAKAEGLAASRARVAKRIRDSRAFEERVFVLAEGAMHVGSVRKVVVGLCSE